jgi:parallel beta-helix repeat protein
MVPVLAANGQNTDLRQAPSNGQASHCRSSDGGKKAPLCPRFYSGILRHLSAREGVAVRKLSALIILALVSVLPITSPASAGGSKTCGGKKATITGTKGSNSLKGTQDADVIWAGGGDDVVSGGGGKDTICGSTGDDTLLGGGGNDRLIGGSGTDTCKGGSGKNKNNTCEGDSGGGTGGDSGAGTGGGSSTPCTGVAVSPGDNVHGKISNNPQGTTFCFAAGTYSLTQPIQPKSYSVLIAKPGTILDGGHVANAAITGFGGATGNRGITIRGFTIQNFANIVSDPAKDAAIKTGWNWLVENNEVRYNKGLGIRTSNATTLRGNNVHHNGKLGIGAAFVDGGLWENNQIAYNNTNKYVGDSGGTKVVKSSNMTFRSNYVHHNNGNGLWTDTDVIHVIFENNTVEYNSGVGIFMELSYDGVIRNNTVRYNAEIARDKSVAFGSNIHLAVSQNVEIYGNTVEADTNGIGMWDTDRGAGPYGPYRVRNVYVHDNVVKMKGTAKSGLHGYSVDAYTVEANNRFQTNTYLVTNLSGSFWMWQAAARNWSAWRGMGQDVSGSVQSWSG